MANIEYKMLTWEKIVPGSFIVFIVSDSTYKHELRYQKINENLVVDLRYYETIIVKVLTDKEFSITINMD